MRKLVGSLAVAGVLVVAACASAEQAGETGTVGPAVVSWVDRPAPPYVVPTPTPTIYPTDARPCLTSDLTGSAGDIGAAGGTANIRIDFINHADTTCVLLGYPRVAGVSADGTVTDLEVGHGSIIGDSPWPASDIAPGQSAAVNISSADACEAAQRGEHRIYPTLRIGLPSGDALDVASHGFDTVCGVSVSRFCVPAYAQPPEEPPPSPLVAHLTAPATADVGQELVYTVTLRNRSATTYSLTPCPAYEEYVVLASGGGSVHPNYYLNCDIVQQIPPGAAVTFEMRLQLPADLGGTGPTKFGWLMQNENGLAAAELLQITD
jgi:hypothetical protein